MKVGISYAVELEEIPEEAQRLIKDVQWDLTQKLDDLVKEIQSGDFGAAFASINNLRHNLQRTNTRLEDCQIILSGFSSILQKMEEEKASAKELELAEEVDELAAGSSSNEGVADA